MPNLTPSTPGWEYVWHCVCAKSINVRLVSACACVCGFSPFLLSSALYTILWIYQCAFLFAQVSSLSWQICLLYDDVSWQFARLLRFKHMFVRTPVCPLSVHVSGTSNLFPSPRHSPPITSLHHLSSLRIHEFLCLQGCDWPLMNNWRHYQSASAMTTK